MARQHHHAIEPEHGVGEAVVIVFSDAGRAGVTVSKHGRTGHVRRVQVEQGAVRVVTLNDAAPVIGLDLHAAHAVVDGRQPVKTGQPAADGRRDSTVRVINAEPPAPAHAVVRLTLPDDEAARGLDRVIGGLLGKFKFGTRIGGVVAAFLKTLEQVGVAQNAKQVRQAQVHVVVDLDLGRLLGHQHGCAAAKRLNVCVVLRKMADDAGGKL